LQLERNHLHHTREKQRQSSNSLNLKPSPSPNPSRELNRNPNQEEKYHNSNPRTHIELNAKDNPNHQQDKNKYCNLRPNLNPEHNLSDNPQDKNPLHRPNPQSERNRNRNPNPNPSPNPLDGYQANPRGHYPKHPRAPNTQFLLPINNPQPGNTLHSTTPRNSNLPDNNLLDNPQNMSWLMRQQSVSAIAYTETALA
jgi:hypothetical protein